MNPNLIPTPDMLGIPAPPWMLQALMALTLALHWMFIGGAVGGTFVVLLNSLRAGRDGMGARMNRAVLSFLPFMVSMGVTLGVAPLLFVQVLYGNFFYTANVLIALPWLLIVPLVIGNVYLLYYAKRCIEKGARLGPILPAIMVGAFAVLATILSSNSVLTQTPPAWQSVWQCRGMGVFLGSSVLPRAAFALFGFVAIGGVFVALLGSTGLMYDADVGQHAVRMGRGVGLPALVMQLAAGGILAVIHSGDLAPTFVANNMVAVAVMAAPILLAASAVFLFRARESPLSMSLAASAVAYFLGLITVAFARDQLRQAALGPYFRLTDLQVSSQWGPFALFVAFFVVAIALIVILWRLATSPIRRPETP